MKGTINVVARGALFVVMLLSGCTAVTELRSKHAQFNELSGGTSGWDHQRRVTFEAQYREWFLPFLESDSLRSLATSDVELLYSAGQLVSFYTTDAYLDDLRQALSELERRDAATPRHYEEMYSAYLHWRQFDRAAKLTLDHPTPGMEALPEIIDSIVGESTQPTELAVLSDRRALERRVVARDERTRIIVVSHPNCHFSRNASDAIDANPELSELFRAHAKWLAPVDGNIGFDALQAWNREHAQAPISIAYRADEWPQIKLTSTPVFYFFSADHQLLETVSGWPDEGRHEEVEAAARRAGLLP